MTEYARNNIIIEFFAKLFQHILQNKKKYIPLHSLNRGNKSGEVVEWSITAVLKTVELRGSGGSNPSLSANKTKTALSLLKWLFFLFYRQTPPQAERDSASGEAATRNPGEGGIKPQFLGALPL